MRSTQKALLVSSIAISIIILIWYFGLHNYFTLASLQANRMYLEQTVQENYLKAVLLFISIYTAVIAVAIPGVPPLTLIGGFLFGFVPGVIYAAFGAAIGTTISFLLIRYVLSNLIKGKYAAKLQKFNEKIAQQGAATYLLTLQLVGIIPYFIINTLAALADVSTFTFFWTTLIGSLPTLCVYTFAGQQLYSLESVSDVFSTKIIMIFVLLALISLLFPRVVKFFAHSEN